MNDAKKHRNVKTKEPMIVYAMDGKNHLFPVIAEYLDRCSGTWELDRFPVESLEEIQPEPIKVGDTFGRYRVVYIELVSGDGEYLCVMPSRVVDDPPSVSWRTETELREAVK